MKRAKATTLKFASAWVMGAVVLLCLFTAQPGLAEDEPTPPCNVATLSGTYIFDASGFAITATGVAPKAVVEVLNMDGDGTLASLATANVNGVVIARNAHGTGTYTVNADCSGTLAFNPQGPHFDIYVAPLGTEFHMIQVDPGQVLAGKVRRVSRERP